MNRLIPYLNIDERTKRSATSVWRIVETEMEQIVDGFYTRTQRHDTGVVLDATTIARLKPRQQDHWKALFHSRFNRQFFEHASMIGIRHQQIGLSATWYIASYSLIKVDMAKAVMTAPLTLGIKIELVATLEKYVALDMACALSSYSAWLID